MLDIIDMLGIDNRLSQMVLHLRCILDKSELDDVQKLSNAAGIKCDAETGNDHATSKYEGKGFNLVFESNISKENEHYWCAEMLISDFAGGVKVSICDEATITISLTDAHNLPLSNGVLRLLGLALKVENGKTFCTLSQLRVGLTKTSVSFESPHHGIVPGHLSLC